MTEPRIYGYVCEDEVAPSRDATIASIEATAKEIDAEWVGCQVENSHFVTVAWGERPGLTAVLRQLHRADHLIVFRLDHLAPAPCGIIAVVEHVARMGVTVHIVNWEGESVSLDDAAGQILVKLLCSTADWFRRTRSRSVRRAKRKLKESGRILPKAPPFGHRRIRARGGAKVDVWDPEQCDIIREIKDRRDSGETFNSIACDFAKRKLRRGNGELWAWFTKGKTTAHLSYIHKVFHWYENLLREGKQLGA